MRYVFGFLGVFALSLVLSVGCTEDGGEGGSGGTAGTGGTGGTSEKYDFSEVDSAAAAFVETFGLDGLTLAVVRKDEGQIYEKGYGDFGSDRVSLVASTSKVLAAGVILTLVDDGSLELDRPVAEYLNWGDHHPTVTIEHLLSMMSGIEGWPAANHTCVHDPATTVKECGRLVFEDEANSIPPGEEFRYSGSAWQLAGAVAEVVSGKSWAELVDERLVEPCGLSNTGFVSTDSQLGYPEAFDGDPANMPPSDNPEIGGGAYTTVSDYSKVLLMHLNGGQCGQQSVLSPEMVQRMQAELAPEGVTFPPWTASPAANYGMGWFRYEDDPSLLVDPGAWGAKAILQPDEGWGAILMIEVSFGVGNLMYNEIVPLIREALVTADKN
jgi:CubicO group peptidase (beta-lactamase class C family)